MTTAARKRYQNAWLKRKRRGPRGGEVREASRSHRAREAGLYGPNAPGPDWEARQLEKQGGLCYWCSQTFIHGPKRVGYDADHVIPLDVGGRHTVENLVLACPLCNSTRGGLQ